MAGNLTPVTSGSAKSMPQSMPQAVTEKAKAKAKAKTMTSKAEEKTQDEETESDYSSEPNYDMAALVMDMAQKALAAQIEEERVSLFVKAAQKAAEQSAKKADVKASETASKSAESGALLRRTKRMVFCETTETIAEKATKSAKKAK